MALAHCVNNSEKSIQGVTTPCYKNWIATPSARNDGNGLSSRNDYGGKFIFGFWNNFNYGFLFNRKNQKKKIYYCQRFSVGEGEQK